MYDQDEPDPQMISISMAEYNKLWQLVPEVERLKNVVVKMKHAIECKNTKLKEQQQTIQRDQKMNMNLSKLSSVILTIYMHYSHHKIKFTCFINYVIGTTRRDPLFH